MHVKYVRYYENVQPNDGDDDWRWWGGVEALVRHYFQKALPEKRKERKFRLGFLEKIRMKNTELTLIKMI